MIVEDRFGLKVKSAAVAAWWTILIAFAFVVLQWLLFLYFNAHPQVWSWLSPLMGGFDWQATRIVWFWSTATLKICIWVLMLVTIWLTLWSRQLMKKNI